MSLLARLVLSAYSLDKLPSHSCVATSFINHSTKVLHAAENVSNHAVYSCYS